MLVCNKDVSKGPIQLFTKLDIGPGAGSEGEGGAEGVPEMVAGVKGSRTAGYLGRFMGTGK